MQLFWERGYAATSIQDLVARTGVNRQSLYDTYGDKHALFIDALERYREAGEEKFRSLLSGAGSVRERFERFFRFYLETAVTDPGRRGCFLVNTAVELAPHDLDSAALLETSLTRTEALFETILEEARTRGDLTATADPRALARFLYSALKGLRVTGKTLQDRARLHDIVEVTLSVFDQN